MSSNTLFGSKLFLSLFAGFVITGTATAQQAGQGLEEITVPTASHRPER